MFPFSKKSLVIIKPSQQLFLSSVLDQKEKNTSYISSEIEEQRTPKPNTRKKEKLAVSTAEPPNEPNKQNVSIVKR